MISKLNNKELDQKIKSLARAENRLLALVIEHIKEADRRKLYLDFNYPNLYDYLVKECGYPGGSAQRRIDAARLLAIEPKLKAKIESGEINLSQTTLLQKAFREKSQTVTLEQKRSLIAKISDMTVNESQVLISKELNLEIRQQTKVTHQKDESIRLEFTLTKEQWESLQKAKDLASNATQTNDLGVLIKYLSDKFIKQKEGPTATVAVKKQVLQRDQCCQYKDHKTQRLCGSRWNLHIDHIKPKWVGGTDDIDNLRVLCQKHNYERYREQAGIKMVSSKIDDKIIGGRLIQADCTHT